MLVYDYALGGHTVNDMLLQVYRGFVKQLGSDFGTAWTAKDTLFGKYTLALSKRHSR